MGIQIDPVPGLDRVVLLLGAGVKRPLIRGQGFAQLPENRRDEGLKVLNILLRPSGGVSSSLLGLSKPRHALPANKLEPSRAHEGKGDLPSAHVHLRIIRSRKKGQMTVRFLLMLSNIASELPHQGRVVSLHLPIGLGVVGRGVVRGYTQQTEIALVIFRGRLRSVVRKDRVGDAIATQVSMNADDTVSAVASLKGMARVNLVNRSRMTSPCL